MCVCDDGVTTVLMRSVHYAVIPVMCTHVKKPSELQVNLKFKKAPNTKLGQKGQNQTDRVREWKL